MVSHEIEPSACALGALMGGGSVFWLSASLYQWKGEECSSQEYLPEMCTECYPVQIFSVRNGCVKMLLKPLVIP